jgi:NAD(P)-dependent dehydrogenase (short-subunit alcohol dehydrogenase family)
MVARCVQAFGSLDILVNNAGIYPHAPVLAMSAPFLDRVLRVNLRGLVLASKAAGRQLAAQGHGGAIVNIASVDALHPSMVGLAAYDASKGGVWMFTRSLALELAPHWDLSRRWRAVGLFRARVACGTIRVLDRLVATQLVAKERLPTSARPLQLRRGVYVWMRWRSSKAAKEPTGNGKLPLPLGTADPGLTKR